MIYKFSYRINKKNNTVHFDSINEDVKLDDFITNFNEYYPSKIYKIIRG